MLLGKAAFHAAVQITIKYTDPCELKLGNLASLGGRFQTHLNITDNKSYFIGPVD
jgi:hypothetical protein